jgi:hypothetical protein
MTNLLLRRGRLLSLLGWLLAGSAHAGTLSNATWFQTAQGIPLTRTFGQLSVTGTSTGSSLAVNLSYPFFAATLFVPKTANSVIDLAVQVTQGGTQAITATAGMANGAPGIPGTVIVMTAVHVAHGVNASVFMVGINTLVAVPLSNGKAGQFTSTFFVVGQLHTITVDFFAWTPGTFLFTGLTSGGDPLPNVTAAGSFSLTAWNGGGMVTLVSPSLVSVDGTFAQRRTAAFTKLVMNFVPEPGTLLLLGAGALAFAYRRL